MMIDPQSMKFARSRNGYDPQEIDAVMMELLRQISDLKQRNASLTDTAAQTEDRLRQMSESNRKLQEERAGESLRVTGLMDAAAKLAEKMERDALDKANRITDGAQREAMRLMDQTRQEAERMAENAVREARKTIDDAKRESDRLCGQARADLAAMQAALSRMGENTQLLRQSNEQYINDSNARLSAIDALLESARSGIPAAPPLPPLTYSPLHTYAAPQSPQQPLYPVPPLPEPDPYDDFVKHLKLAGLQPTHSQPGL